MAHLKGKQRTEYVRQMFARLSGHYDRANRVMTWGQDIRWRREVLKLARLPQGGKLLDAGTGTGDLALGCIARDPSSKVVGLDFTIEMIKKARLRQGAGPVTWIHADALNVPFKAGSFDAVVSGYLLRNVINIDRVLAEQYRVLTPGGRIICLDSTPLPNDPWHLPARFYEKHIIPLIGWLIAGDREAYTYLPRSTQGFLTAEELKVHFAGVGFKNVSFKRLMAGSMAIHWGEK